MRVAATGAWCVLGSNWIFTLCIRAIASLNMWGTGSGRDAFVTPSTSDKLYISLGRLLSFGGYHWITMDHPIYYSNKYTQSILPGNHLKPRIRKKSGSSWWWKKRLKKTSKWIIYPKDQGWKSKQTWNHHLDIHEPCIDSLIPYLLWASQEKISPKKKSPRKWAPTSSKGNYFTPINGLIHGVSLRFISPLYSLSRPKHPEKKVVWTAFCCPTKYVIPKSLKFSHWPSKYKWIYGAHLAVTYFIQLLAQAARALTVLHCTCHSWHYRSNQRP